jgi:1-pyrroline-5-carboxylate dehydrogenase
VEKEIRSGKTTELHPPHEKIICLVIFRGHSEHVKQPYDAALAARSTWAEMSWKTGPIYF